MRHLIEEVFEVNERVMCGDLVSAKAAIASTNMKKFLSYCSEVLTAYKIATELGFQDLAVNLLEGEAGSYLKDVA